MKTCPKCNARHEKSGTYCSRSCANSRQWSPVVNEKRRAANKAAVESFSESKKQEIKEKRLQTRNITGNRAIPRLCEVCGKAIGYNKYNKCQRCFFDSPDSEHVLGHYRKYKKLAVQDSCGQDVLLQSSLEIAYYKHLMSNEIEWIRPKSLPYVDKLGRKRWYRPDFLLIKTKEYIEIKGHMWDGDVDKMEAVVTQHKDKIIRIMFKQDLINAGVL